MTEIDGKGTNTNEDMYGVRENGEKNRQSIFPQMMRKFDASDV
jgi:hypothetical protein